MELLMLEVVFWVVRAVHHPAGAADGGAKLLLACILAGKAWSVFVFLKSRDHDVKKKPTYDDELVIVMLFLPPAGGSLFGG